MRSVADAIWDMPNSELPDAPAPIDGPMFNTLSIPLNGGVTKASNTEMEVRTWSRSEMLVRAPACGWSVTRKERVRDVLTGETYDWVAEIDGGYALARDAMGADICLGLRAWERFTE